MIATSIILSACGGGSHGSVAPGDRTGADQSSSSAASNAQIAAIVGNNNDQMLARIAEAKRAGKTPRYVTVSAVRATYTFTPFAQIVHANRAVLVRGFGKIYGFRASDVHIRYSGYPADTPVDQLPSVSAPHVDAAAGMRSAPARGNVAKKGSVCPDCFLFIVNRKKAKALAGGWHSLKDPWQLSPDYTVAFGGTSTSSGRRTSSNPNCTLSNCGSSSSSFGSSSGSWSAFSSSGLSSSFSSLGSSYSDSSSFSSSFYTKNAPCKVSKGSSISQNGKASTFKTKVPDMGSTSYYADVKTGFYDANGRVVGENDMPPNFGETYTAGQDFAVNFRAGPNVDTSGGSWTKIDWYTNGADGNYHKARTDEGATHNSEQHCSA